MYTDTCKESEGLTYEQASDFCESHSGRLCSVEEVRSCVPFTIGCMDRRPLVWTGDEGGAEPPPAKAAKANNETAPTEAAGATPAATSTEEAEVAAEESSGGLAGPGNSAVSSSFVEGFKTSRGGITVPRRTSPEQVPRQESPAKRNPPKPGSFPQTALHAGATLYATAEHLANKTSYNPKWYDAKKKSAEMDASDPRLWNHHSWDNPKTSSGASSKPGSSRSNEEESPQLLHPGGWALLLRETHRALRPESWLTKNLYDPGKPDFSAMGGLTDFLQSAGSSAGASAGATGAFHFKLVLRERKQAAGWQQLQKKLQTSIEWTQRKNPLFDSGPGKAAPVNGGTAGNQHPTEPPHLEVEGYELLSIETTNREEGKDLFSRFGGLVRARVETGALLEGAMLEPPRAFHNDEEAKMRVVGGGRTASLGQEGEEKSGGSSVRGSSSSSSSGKGTIEAGEDHDDGTRIDTTSKPRASEVHRNGAMSRISDDELASSTLGSDSSVIEKTRQPLLSSVDPPRLLVGRTSFSPADPTSCKDLIPTPFHCGKVLELFVKLPRKNGVLAEAEESGKVGVVLVT